MNNTPTPMGITISVVNDGENEAIYGDIAVMTVKDDEQVSIKAYKRYQGWMNNHHYRLALVASEKIAVGERGRVQIAGPFAGTLEMLER